MAGSRKAAVSVRKSGAGPHRFASSSGRSTATKRLEIGSFIDRIPPDRERRARDDSSLYTRTQNNVMSLEERIRQLRERPEPPNEESAKNWVILPILAHLGWPSDDPEHVLFEHATGRGRMDIALRTGGRIVAFIEAKAPGKRLEGHVEQMLTYAFHEGVDICALTTGLEWWLFLPREKGPPMDRRFAVLDIRKGSAHEFSERIFKFLGREALAGEGAERSAKEALKALREEERLKTVVPHVWGEMKTGPDPELVELIQKRVKEKTALYPTPSQVARALGMAEPVEREAGADDTSTDSAQARGTVEEDGVTPPTMPELVDPPPKKKGTGRASPTPVRSYRLWGPETQANTWKELLLGVFEGVYTRHESTFLETVTPLWGKRKPWVSTDPGDLREPRRIGQSELFVGTTLSAKAIQKRCHRLLKAFGYPASDLEIRQD